MGAPFHSQVWNLRLQIIWLFFAAIYVFVGQFTNDRLISSLLVTLGTGVICMIFAHALFDRDAASARSTLLIALASCFFLVEKSYELFHDPGGSFFLTLFGIMCASLLWHENRKARRERLLVIYFVTLSYSALCSLTMLGANLLVKWIIREGFGNGGYYIAAPHTTGILAGISIGLMCGIESYHHMSGRGTFERKRNRLLLLATVILLLSSAYMYMANSRRLAAGSGEMMLPLAYCFAYNLAYLVPPCLAILAGCGRRKRMFILLPILSPLLTAPIAALLDFEFVRLFNRRDLEYVDFLLIEFVVSFTLAVTLFISMGFFGVVSSKQAERVEDLAAAFADTAAGRDTSLLAESPRKKTGNDAAGLIMCGLALGVVAALLARRHRRFPPRSN